MLTNVYPTGIQERKHSHTMICDIIKRNSFNIVVFYCLFICSCMNTLTVNKFKYIIVFRLLRYQYWKSRHINVYLYKGHIYISEYPKIIIKQNYLCYFLFPNENRLCLLYIPKFCKYSKSDIANLVIDTYNFLFLNDSWNQFP